MQIPEYFQADSLKILEMFKNILWNFMKMIFWEKSWKIQRTILNPKFPIQSPQRFVIISPYSHENALKI